MACLGEKCCDDLLECGMDPACKCLAECVGAGGASQTCQLQCGIPVVPADYYPLYQCKNAECPDNDECG